MWQVFNWKGAYIWGSMIQKYLPLLLKSSCAVIKPLASSTDPHCKLLKDPPCHGILAATTWHIITSTDELTDQLFHGGWLDEDIDGSKVGFLDGTDSLHVNVQHTDLALRVHVTHRFLAIEGGQVAHTTSMRNQQHRHNARRLVL